MNAEGHAGAAPRAALPLADWQPVAVLTTTVGSAEAAQQLAQRLLAQRLVACVQIDAIVSHYVWDGRAHAEPEWRVQGKTPPRLAAAALAAIAHDHPYALPQLLLREEYASPAYAQWVQAQTSAESA